MADVAKMMAEASGPLPARAVAPACQGPEVEGGLTRSQRDRLEIAGTLAAGSVEQRRQAALMVRRVEAERAAAREAAAVERDLDIAEARILAEDGEVMTGTGVEAIFLTDRFGAVMRHQGEPVVKLTTVRRVSRVDGLTSAWRSGHVSDAGKVAGERYRSLVEQARPPVVTASLEPKSGGRVDREAAMAAAMSRGFAARTVSAIHEACGPDIARVLAAVAGEGRTLRSLGEAGNVRIANQSRLRFALRVVEITIKEVERSPLPEGTA